MKFENSEYAIRTAAKIATKYMDDLDTVPDKDFVAVMVNIGLGWIAQSIKLVKEKSDLIQFITGRMYEYQTESQGETCGLTEQDVQRIASKAADVDGLMETVFSRIFGCDESDETKLQMYQMLVCGLIMNAVEMTDDKRGLISAYEQFIQGIKEMQYGR